MIEQQGLAALGPPGDVTEENRDIKMRDGTASQIKIHKGASPGGPLILLNFGGGFTSGSRDQMTPIARGMVRVFGAVVVNSSYRLTPEHKFPTQTHDVFDTLKWCASNAAELGADPKQGFIVGGVSAGGNLSAVVAQMAHEEHLSPPLTGQWLSIPAIFDTGKTVPEKYKHLYISREQNAEAPILDKDALDALRHFSHWDEESPLWAPINSKASLEGLPPAYLQACGMDPIRDDALIYESILRDNGVKTRMDVYPGCPHGHWAFFPMLQTSQKAGLDIFMGFGWLLGKEVKPEDVEKAMAPVSA